LKVFRMFMLFLQLLKRNYIKILDYIEHWLVME